MGAAGIFYPLLEAESFSVISAFLDDVKCRPTEMDPSLMQMPELIEEDSDFHKQKKIPSSQELHCMYQSLSEHYQELTEKLGGALSAEDQMMGSDNFEYNSHKSSPLSSSVKSQSFPAVNNEGFVASLSSGSTSLLSLEEGAEFSSSFSDSESESVKSINSYKPRINNNGRELKPEAIEIDSEDCNGKETVQMNEQENKDDLLLEEDGRNYNSLLDCIGRAEKDLSMEKRKTDNLQAKLESAEKCMQEREADLAVEKKKVLELQNHIAELETKNVDCDVKIGRLEEELEETRGRLKGSKEEIAMLKDDLENLASEHEREIRELKELMRRTLDRNSYEKEEILSGMIRQFEVEKMEMKNFHVAQETALQCVIDQITEELHERRERTEALNKDLDQIKLNFDNLLVEKNSADSKFEALVAEMSLKDYQMNEMNRLLHQLRMENFGLLSGSESLQRLIDELRMRVEELEEKESKHSIVISDRAEEKREAIRQLCFSLEYYRNEYQELRRAFSGNKHRALAAA